MRACVYRTRVHVPGTLCLSACVTGAWFGDEEQGGYGLGLGLGAGGVRAALHAPDAAFIWGSIARLPACTCGCLPGRGRLVAH